MITYPIFSNFSAKIFSTMISAVQYFFLHCESHLFCYWWFLLYFILTKNWNQKRKNTQWNSNICFFCARKWMIYLAWRMYRLQKKFDSWSFDEKMCLKGIWCCIFMVRGILQGKGSRWWTLDKFQYKHGLNNRL